MQELGSLRIAMPNGSVSIHPDDGCTSMGTDAIRFSLSHPALIDQLREHPGTNNAWVYEGEVLIAAQSTYAGAYRYHAAKPGRILLFLDSALPLAGDRATASDGHRTASAYSVSANCGCFFMGRQIVGPCTQHAEDDDE